MSATATTVRIHLVRGEVTRDVDTALFEPVSQWLAITPEVRLDDAGGVVFSGRFAVTHVPSGWAASRGSGCIECARHLGRLLLALDWPTAPADISRAAYTAWLESHDRELLDRIRPALDLSWICDAEACERDEATS